MREALERQIQARKQKLVGPGEEPDDQLEDFPEEDFPPLPPTWRDIISERILDYDHNFNTLGIETGISPAVIWRFVKRERDLRLVTAEKLCQALDLVLVPRESLPHQD
jgi:hypothetical protein